ncbi:MAG: amidohydrolase family protein [Sedimentisphaerales bacterium]|nr:amidohydrolase family protein [Sedimentisphaerales bacterium]
MEIRNTISRRTTLKGIGSAGALALLGGHATADQPAVRVPGIGENDIRKTLFKKVFQTPLIDTHEHLIEESERLQARHNRVRSDDWSLLLSHYLDSDLLTSGMPQSEHGRFFSPDIDPVDKWKILESYWPNVRSTGYGMAVEIAMQHLYDVPQLSKDTAKQVAESYDRVRKAGFYHDILCKQAMIESCQVNCLSEPFKKSDMPQLLMQDISIVGMFSGPNINRYAKPAGIEVKQLSDWHRVIDWWFETYGPYAVAVKSQHAYGRDIDNVRIPAEAVEPVFAKRMEGKSLDGQENKNLQDHLFWYAVDWATAASLPVKLHTGYYAGQNSMPLSRLIHNPGSATELCRLAPKTRFVFMHICYPYYEEILSVAKQWTNAYIDMCWSWIINPVAAKDFLKKYLVTAPANKILTFGGDYIPVEPVLGHAIIARRGIALALAELVEEGWITLDRAIELTDTIMHQNARKLFHLEDKAKRLMKAPWAV